MQPITPVEIKQKSFEKRFRGYNTDEVDAFLHSLAHTWEKVVVQLDQVTAALGESKREVKRLHELEHALLKTIKDSELAAHDIIEQAQREADLITKKTKIEAEKLLLEATEKAKEIEKDSAQKQQHVKEQTAKELELSQEMIQEAETYRDTVLQKLLQLAEDILTEGHAIKANFHHLGVSKETEEVTPHSEVFSS